MWHSVDILLRSECGTWHALAPDIADIAVIERDEDWLTRNGVDIVRAKATIVPWRGDLFGGIRGHG